MFFSRKKEEKNTPVPVATAAQNEVQVVEEKPVQVEPQRKKGNVRMDYEVLISKNTAINGNININGCTRIDGVIDGTLAVNSDLFIGEAGNIRATVYTQNAVIAGTVTGNICCRERLELKGTAHVTGDVKCGTLIINEGAVFHGRSMGFDEEADSPEAVAAPEAE